MTRVLTHSIPKPAIHLRTPIDSLIPPSYIILIGLRQRLGLSLFHIRYDFCASLQTAFNNNSSLYQSSSSKILFKEAQPYPPWGGFSSDLRSIMANANGYSGFEDFDDLSVYKKYEAAISDNATHNMVIEFDSARASSVLNIDNPAMRLVLGTKVNLNPRKKIHQIRQI